ncbi:MAG TPA: ribonuclease HI family protein [Terracidiphilus sp.]|nr:ribonuclease HI family protein [Terracidiphilus sp.]
MTRNLFGGSEPAVAGGWYVAHCDGGSRGNPGPAGYGAVVEDPEGRVVAQLSEFLGKQTNNFAEYSGLLAVLKWANEHGVTQLKVVSDSELMVNQMKGRYKVGSPTLRPLWEEAKREAARIAKFQMAHTLRGGNKDADRLANEAMDRGMGRKPQGTGVREQGPEGHSAGPAAGAQQAPPARRQVLDGFVKNGVVHLLEGELPDGVYVKVIRES